MTIKTWNFRPPTVRGRDDPYCPPHPLHRVGKAFVLELANVGPAIRAFARPSRRAGGAEHLYFSRSVCPPEKAGAAVVAWQRLQCDDLAGAQGILRPRAVSGLACRYGQEISRDVCVPRPLRKRMGP